MKTVLYVRKSNAVQLGKRTNYRSVQHELSI
nr:MAG TPA: hypothetical protein [Caudoviricetes sp.]